MGDAPGEGGGEVKETVPSDELAGKQPQPTGASITPPGEGAPEAGGGASAAPPPAFLTQDPKVAGLVDREGRPFDPKLHQTKAGEPVLNADGTVRKKPINRGRRGELPPEPGAPPPRHSGAQSSIPPAPDVTSRYRTTAQVTVAMYVGALSMLGEHWKCAAGEFENQVDAWCEYYEARGMIDLPPELALAVVVLGYVGGTEARRADLWATYQSMRGGNDARADSGQDGSGQVHTLETLS